ncbi:MAG: hypothetical protein R3A48_26605 [Polyangiales bacterium]
MSDTFTRSGAPLPLGVPVVAIRDGVPDGPFPAATPAPRGTGTPCLYANHSLNGRLPHPLPVGRWVLSWSSPIEHALRPDAVLTAGERLVAAREGVWELFDLEGNRIRHGATESHRPVLDPVAGGLWTVAHSGILAAHDLADGARRFVVHTRSGMDYHRVHLDADAERVLLTSIEVIDDIHEGGMSQHAFMERVDLGADTAPDASGFLRSATAGPHLVHQDDAAGTRPYESRVSGLLQSPQGEPRMLAASWGDALHLATFDRLYVLDREMNVVAAFSDRFEPLALSVDERGRMHLVVRTADGDAYWTVDRAGVRVVTAALPEGPSTFVAPPIVGHNHAVFLVSTRAIYALRSDVGLHWSFAADDDIVGAVITADELLLVTTRRGVYALNARGEVGGLIAAPEGEDFCAPVVVTEHDTLVAATEAHLLHYAIEALDERTFVGGGYIAT